MYRSTHRVIHITHQHSRQFKYLTIQVDLCDLYLLKIDLQGDLKLPTHLHLYLQIMYMYYFLLDMN